MADHPSQYYQEFMAYLAADEHDIRGAIFDKLYPCKTGTRSINKFEHVIIPAILDLMENFYEGSGLIDANVHFFSSLEKAEVFSGQLIDKNFIYSHIKYLADIIKLGLGDVEVSGDDITNLTTRHLPELSAILLEDDDGERRASSGYIDFERFHFHMVTLLDIHFDDIYAFGKAYPEEIRSCPPSPNSSTHSITTQALIKRLNDEFGNESLFINVDNDVIDALSENEPPVENNHSNEYDQEMFDNNIRRRDYSYKYHQNKKPANDIPPLENELDNQENLVVNEQVNPTVVNQVNPQVANIKPRTVLGGASVFDDLLDLSDFVVDPTSLNWFKMIPPTGWQLKTGGNQELLIGFSEAVEPEIQSQHGKLITRNVGLQVAVKQTSIDTQTIPDVKVTIETQTSPEKKPDPVFNHDPLDGTEIIPQTSKDQDRLKANIQLQKWRDWLNNKKFFHLALVPVGKLTGYARLFLDGTTKTVQSASDTVQKLDVGTTVITVGYDGYTVKEYPQLGFQPTKKTRVLPMFEEYQMWYAKMYRITQNHKVITHPVLHLSHYPFLALNDMLQRAFDKRLQSRCCVLTKWPSPYNAKGLTGDPTIDPLIESYEEFLDMNEKKVRGTFEYGPHSPETTQQLFNLVDMFDMENIEKAQAYKNRVDILKKEMDQFRRHIYDCFMCRQRFSRSMIHDLERELTLGCICADVVDTKETATVVREQRQKLLPDAPFLKPRTKKIPRHVFSRGRVLANPKNQREIGCSLILISGKASVYENGPNFRTGYKWACATVLCCFAQHPANPNNSGSVGMDILDVREEAISIFKAVANHCRYLCSRNNFPVTSEVNQKCFDMIDDCIHCYQFISRGQCSWIDTEKGKCAPYYNNTCARQAQDQYYSDGFLKFCTNEDCKGFSCVVNTRLAQLILTILDGLNKCEVQNYLCPVPADVVGEDQIEKFLANYCRLASSTEVYGAGFIYEDVADKKMFYYLDRSPVKTITVPGIKGKHVLKGKWSVGTVFHKCWLTGKD